MRIAALALALSMLVVLLFVPAPPASADPGKKALNTASNTLLGWTNCPKAIAAEVGKGKTNFFRGLAGVVTGPVMCGVNVAATYASVPIDALTIPWGSNLLPPAAHESHEPPLKLPF